MKIKKNTLTYDIEFNEPISCPMIKEKSEYGQFCNTLYSLVSINDTVKEGLIVNWCHLIDENWAAFEEFLPKLRKKYDDEDMFVFYCIQEIDKWLNKKEDFNYAKLLEFVTTLQGV